MGETQLLYFKGFSLLTKQYTYMSTTQFIFKPWKERRVK